MSNRVPASAEIADIGQQEISGSPIPPTFHPVEEIAPLPNDLPSCFHEPRHGRHCARGAADRWRCASFAEGRGRLPVCDGCARRGDRHVPCVVATSRQAGTKNVERGIQAGAIGTIIAALHPQETAASTMSKTIDLAAEPYAFTLSPEHCALLIIDMQRDFLEPGGFGEMLGNDVSQLRRTIEPNRRLLAAWRASGLPALHTREGHRPDLRFAAGQEGSRNARRRSATLGRWAAFWCAAKRDTTSSPNFIPRPASR